MAHELTIRTNGKAEMAALNGTGVWHGLGQTLEEGATIEQWIESAGMDWRVLRSKVRYETEREHTDTSCKEWPEQQVLFRSDTKAPLGVVSDGFKIVQPKEVLEFFRDLCETNDFKLRTAGTLFGGKRFWALADIGEESFVLDPQDRVKGRLLLVTACDGSMKTTAKFVSECVVCNNTLTMARAENGKQIAVSHRSVFNPADAKQKLGLADGQFSRFIADVRSLAMTPVALDHADLLTLKLVDSNVVSLFDRVTTANEAKVEEIRATRGYKQIMELFEGGAIASNLGGRGRTAWGWLNAVTEYADHHVSARSVDNRFNSAQFGAGEKLKNDAFAIALAA
jgi:phage/plasmid-like protein (TIGR03299 family)